MARRCPTCRAPLTEEIVFHRKIGLDNKPQLYHYVRRYTCPEGCTVRLDFSKAKPLTPGKRPMVLGRVESLQKPIDFNDKLLGLGLLAALALFIVGFFATPLPIAVKAGASGALVLFSVGLYRFANRREVLPESFPRPIPEPEPVEVVESEESAAVQPSAPGAASGAKKKKVEVEIPDEIPPLTRAEGDPLKMWVILDGEEHELELNDDELMLDAALNREVELDYSCREGMCDSCMVRILAGVENLSDPTQEEVDMLDEDIQKGFRLSCQVRVKGPVKILQE